MNPISMPTLRSTLILLASLLTFAASALAAAFPGAQGYGADASGGRGGRVIHVTNLNASGPDSLQEALSASGPRMIVFDVSGVITADTIHVEHGDFTLAGETAPGGGITLNARLFSTYQDFSVTNFIIRHIRIRPTNLSGEQGDAVRFANNSRFILDHISTSWGSDETIDLYQSDHFTLQWSTVEESATHAGHPDGDFHNYGLINGPDGSDASVHHNLFAHHSHRSPAIANGTSDIINNVVYNFKRGFVHHNDADTAGFNFIGNYYKAGPDDDNPIAILIDDSDLTSGPYYYLEDLYYNGVAADPWDLVGIYPATISPAPSQAAGRFTTPPMTIHSCTDAYDRVLARAGAWPRDTVTLRTIGEVENGTGSWGRHLPADLMQGLTPTTAPQDTDNDGMPDDWETDRGFNPGVADDDGDDDNDGYTNIEEYLHYRSDLLIYGGTPPCTENWSCTDWSDWSDCANDSQTRTRTCTDLNACGTRNDKPGEIESQSCSPGSNTPDEGSGSGGCFIHAAYNDWAEGSQAAADGATRDYYNRAGRLEWDNYLGDWHDADNVAQGASAYATADIVDNDTPRYIEWNVRQLVQEWVDGTHPNQGFFLHAVSGASPINFRSKEYGDADRHPQLVVNTGSGESTLSPVADTYLSPSTYRSMGDSDQLTLTMNGSNVLLRFDLSTIAPATPVTSAILRLYSHTQYGNTSLAAGVFRCAQGEAVTSAAPIGGLAAEYTDDQGIENHPDVVFATGFEADNWEEAWTSASGTIDVVSSDTPRSFVALLGKALRARIPEGENSSMSVIYKFADKIGEEPEEIYFRYYLRFADDWNQTVYGGKLPGISGTYGRAGWGGRKPDGTDGWSARGTYYLSISGDNPLSGTHPIGTYCYYADQPGTYGDSWPWNKEYKGFLKKNRWHCIEQYVQMNTPGEHDGIIRAWVDGRPAFEKTDIMFRTVDTLKIEQIWMNVYHGGTAVSPYDQHLYIDNVVVARQYIGPMNGQVPDEPDDPENPEAPDEPDDPGNPGKPDSPGGGEGGSGCYVSTIHGLP